MYEPDRRVPRGLRRLEVMLPFDLVIELDRAIAELGHHRSRSKVIAAAIRRLLDQGGPGSLEFDGEWP